MRKNNGSMIDAILSCFEAFGAGVDLVGTIIMCFWLLLLALLSPIWLLWWIVSDLAGAK